MWLRCGALGDPLVATPVGAATPCPPASFTIDTADRPAVAAVIGGPVEQIVVAGDHVAVSSCDPPAKIEGKRSRTIVKAKGGPCGATRKLRVKVKMSFPASPTSNGITSGQLFERPGTNHEDGFSEDAVRVAGNNLVMHPANVGGGFKTGKKLLAKRAGRATACPGAADPQSDR